MLHKVLLRLSLTFAVIALILLLPINMYKNEIVAGLIQRYSTIPIEITELEGILPFEAKAKSVKIGDACRIEDLQASLSLHSLLTGHLRFKKLDAEKIILLDRPNTSTTKEFNIPTLSFLKKFEIKTFATSLEKENSDLKVALKGKLRDGTLFSHLNYYDKKAELVIREDEANVKTEAFGEPLSFKAMMKDKQIIWQTLLGKRAMAVGRFSDKGILSINNLEAKVFEPHTFKLTQPIQIDVTKALMVEEAKFSFLDETIFVKNLILANELKGTLTADISKPQFWKTLHPNIEIEGKINLKAILSGKLSDPEVNLEANIIHLQHETIPAIKIEKGNIKGKFKNKKLNINADIDGKHALKMRAVSEVDLSQNNVLSTINADLNLKNIKTLLPKKDKISGQVKGQITIQGSLQSPVIKGNITVREGYFENYMIGTHITNLNGSLTLDQNHYYIQLSGKDDFKGTATVKGEGDLSTKAGILHANLDHFYLGQSDLFTALVTGHATVDLAQKRVQGTLTAHRVIVDLDQLTPSSTPKIELLEKVDQLAEKQKEATKKPNEFFLDLIMTPENGVVVRGFGIQSLWDGYMKLHGTNPDFVGDFTLKRGTIDILDRVMTLTRGHITFDHEIDKPYLDIDISKKIQDYKVLVNLQGRSSDPKFNFRSDPPLTQEEILGLILMGRKSAAGSIGQLVELSSSLSSLTNQGSENFFSKFRKAFGIEALEIKKLEQNSTSEAPQALSVRKQITPDFTLIIEQGLTSTEEETKSTRASIEANITENLNVEVDVSSNKNGGVGLNWVKRY